MKLIWTIEAERDDLPIKGNIIDSGDKEYDRKVEMKLHDRLCLSNIWAWASVKVECVLKVDGQTFSGCDYLGGCSYENEEDFIRNSGYYEQMKSQARTNLMDSLRHIVRRGEIAKQVLDGEHNV